MFGGCEVQENERRKNVRTDEDVAVRSITLGALLAAYARRGRRLDAAAAAVR